MPTTKLLLQEPYLKLTEKEKQAKKEGKKIERKLNPRETRLYLYLILDHDKVAKIKTEHVIFPAQWDFRMQQKKEILAGSPEFNEKLSNLKKSILNKYNELKNSFPDIPFSEVAAALKVFGKEKEIPFQKKDKTFFQILDEFISSMEEEKSYRTIQKFGTLKNSLQEFGKANPKYGTLSFSMINKSFLTAFTKYLRNQEPRGRQKSRPKTDQYGLLNDTIGKYIECLKTFLKWAEEYPTEENPYNKYSAYKKFSNSGRKREKRAEDIVTLTLQELRQFYTFDFSDRPVLARARDLFCLLCFTGQRWSDIERLDKEEIHGDQWEFNAYKTHKQTKIYFTGYASPSLDILKRYDFQLPKISPQKFNVNLKKAAEVAGINTITVVRRYVGAKEIKIVKPKYKFLGSHCGRRTCVSILLNDFNMNVVHVMGITGHSDISTLQRYVKGDDQARRDAMSQTKRIDEPLTVVKSQAV